MLDTKAIRNKILDLAIQGKLTRQLSEDGDAESLYNQIQEEKASLFKKGIVKRRKSIPGISADEIPFKIPHNWKWYRLGEISLQITDGTHRTPKYMKEGVPFLSVKNISAGFLDLTDIKHISVEEHEELIKRCRPEKDDILICRIGTLGKALRIDTDLAFSIFVSLGLIKTGSRVLSDYIAMVINSGFGIKWILEHKAGGAMHADKINLTDLNLLPIPLPPLSEQEKIFLRVEELLSSVKEIDELRDDYYRNLDVLKKKIIDAGIRGELTEQLPEDGTAEELYERIQAEKEALIKEKKIRKSKPLPEITEDDIPFAVPNNWKWVRMGDIFQHNTGKALNASNKDGEMFEYITTSNVYWDRFELANIKCMPFRQNEIEKCTVRKGDLLVCEGGDIGRSAVWPYEREVKIQNHIHRLRGYSSSISHKYYYFVMRLYKTIGMIDGRGIGLQGFSSKRLHSLVVPLPPYNEQIRIVERIEELLAAMPK